MKPPIRLTLHLAPTRAIFSPRPALLAQKIHTTSPSPATVSPIHGTGPPPEAPVAEAENSKAERRKKQTALLQAAQDIRASHNAKSEYKSNSSSNEPLRKRFWKDVHVKEVDGAWEVHLDVRPLRHPSTKEIIRLPLSKPLLAAALAHEWDMLDSAQQATKSHLIPLTSLVCRALDIADDDVAPPPKGVQETIRKSIARTLMRYLVTDSLLCWAPPLESYDVVEGVESLRDRQIRVADEVIAYLKSRVWPGIEIEPVLDEGSIMPKEQNAMTKWIVEGWIMGLDPWELAGLERGVLAGKGLLGAVRLLAEWSEGFVGAGGAGEKKFGVEEAAKAASLEVDWQIGRWGEVEDTHDVEKEDLRRQLGSVVLLVSGTGRK